MSIIPKFNQSSFFIVGRSGYGKTMFALELAYTIIKHNYPLIMLDGKGELFELLKNFCAHLMMEPEGVCFIDPASDYVPGFNILEPLEGIDPISQAEIITEAILKAFKEQEEDAVWIKEYGPAVFAPMITTNLIMTEALDFIQDASFRKTVLHKANLPHYTKKWNHFDQNFKPYEKAKILQSLTTRIDRIIRNPYLSAMLGQKKTTLNIKQVINTGEGVFLANLGQGAKGQQPLELIGALLLHHINILARQKNRISNNPIFVICDEFQKFVSADIADALDQLRHYGVFFILINQRLDQIERQDPDTLSAIMTNADNKIIFATSRADAEILYGEIFTGQIHKEMGKVKDEIETTSFWPEQFWKDIISTTEGESEGESSSYNYSWQEQEQEGHQETFGHNEGSSEGETETEHETTDEKDKLLNKASGISKSKNTNESDSYSYGYTVSVSKSSGGSEGYAHQHTTQHSTTSTPALITKYKPFQQTTSRTYYSEPEARERLIAEICAQPKRHCHIKIGNQPPISIKTPDVKQVRLTSWEVAEYEKRIYDLHKPILTIQQEDKNYDYLLQQIPLKDEIEYYDPDTSQPKRKR